MLGNLAIKHWITGFINPVAFLLDAEDLWGGEVVLVHSDENYKCLWSKWMPKMLGRLETSLGGKA